MLSFPILVVFPYSHTGPEDVEVGEEVEEVVEVPEVVDVGVDVEVLVGVDVVVVVPVVVVLLGSETKTKVSFKITNNIFKNVKNVEI